MGNLTKRQGDFEYRLQDDSNVPQVGEPQHISPGHMRIKDNRLNHDLPQMPYRPMPMPSEQFYYPNQLTEQEDSSLSLLDLVRESSTAYEDDDLLTKVYRELTDIEAKLEIIDYLKKMEKTLRKRSKVLLSLIDKLEETEQELHEVGADSLDSLTEKDIEVFHDIVRNEESLDNKSKKIDNKKSKSIVLDEKTRLSDFDV